MGIDPARIGALADQCVKCGLCLPVCPTYRIARNEVESPRGRIALAQSLADQTHDASASLIRHLDQCLACMSCERVCPSHVRYGELIVGTRALLRERAPVQSRRARTSWIMHRPRLLGIALTALDLPPLRQCVDSGIGRSLLRKIGLERLLRERPHLPRRTRASIVDKPTVPRGRVGLFLGCVASVVDRDVHAAAQTLLHALGYEVVMPSAPACCGALALHDGDVKAAARLSTATQSAFDEARLDMLLVSASGCFGTLRDRVFANSSMTVCDIQQFLVQDPRWPQLKFRPLPATIALHTPCTQANVVRSGDAIHRLLASIPQLSTVSLPREPGCCGAAGDYFQRHADIADALRQQTLDAVSAAKPDMLVTSNVGCRIFLDNGLRRSDTPIPLTHPIALLARQLDN